MTISALRYRKIPRGYGRVLGLDIEEMGPISLTSKEPCSISSTALYLPKRRWSRCAPMEDQEDIVAGIHRAVASRVAIMGKNVGYKSRWYSRGVAKNLGVKALSKLESDFHTDSREPQIVGPWERHSWPDASWCSPLDRYVLTAIGTISAI